MDVHSPRPCVTCPSIWYEGCGRRNSHSPHKEKDWFLCQEEQMNPEGTLAMTVPITMLSSTESAFWGTQVFIRPLSSLPSQRPQWKGLRERKGLGVPDSCVCLLGVFDSLGPGKKNGKRWSIFFLSFKPVLPQVTKYISISCQVCDAHFSSKERGTVGSHSIYC